MSLVGSPSFANRTVFKVLKLLITSDVCDLTIKDNHNFSLDCGIFIHNSKSNLASLDLHFAKTVERVQRIVVDLLTKIAFVHLYSQGYTNLQLTNFELLLTNPSILYLLEKINLWQNRVSLIRDIRDLKMVSDDYIYLNFLLFSLQLASTQRLNLMQDMKRNYLYDKMMNLGTVELAQLLNLDDNDFSMGDLPLDNSPELMLIPLDSSLLDKLSLLNNELASAPLIDKRYKSPQKNKLFKLGNLGNPLAIDQKLKKTGFTKKSNLFGMDDLKQMYGKKLKTLSVNPTKEKMKRLKNPLNTSLILMLELHLSNQLSDNNNNGTKPFKKSPKQILG